MIFDYYWCQVEVIEGTSEGREGRCLYDTQEDYAELRLSNDLSGDVKRGVFVHEIGHVWQGMKGEDLVTRVKWPNSHSANLTARENFPEVLRVAVCGLKSYFDEEIMFEWAKGPQGTYHRPVDPTRLREFEKNCKDEVIRLLGFMPTIPDLTSH